jgi:hypothetical protein
MTRHVTLSLIIGIPICAIIAFISTSISFKLL